MFPSLYRWKISTLELVQHKGAEAENTFLAVAISQCQHLAAANVGWRRSRVEDDATVGRTVPEIA